MNSSRDIPGISELSYGFVHGWGICKKMDDVPSLNVNTTGDVEIEPVPLTCDSGISRACAPSETSLFVAIPYGRPSCQ